MAQEREWQRQNFHNDDKHTEDRWVAILTRQLGLAANDGGASDRERFLRQMVRVAATAAAAFEAASRNNQATEKVAGYTPEPWRQGV